MVARFKGRFGPRVAVLHSGLSGGERFDEWRKIRSGEVQVAIGARSAILDRKSTRLNSSHVRISYAVFCLKQKSPDTPQRPSERTSEGAPDRVAYFFLQSTAAHRMSTLSLHDALPIYGRPVQGAFRPPGGGAAQRAVRRRTV